MLFAQKYCAIKVLRAGHRETFKNSILCDHQHRHELSLTTRCLFEVEEVGVVIGWLLLVLPVSRTAAVRPATVLPCCEAVAETG